jgi:hypothetical protein
MYNKDIAMLDERKCEIFLEIQQHNGIIFTKNLTVNQARINNRT